jgi:hypothetical protein
MRARALLPLLLGAAIAPSAEAQGLRWYYRKLDVTTGVVVQVDSNVQAYALPEHVTAARVRDVGKWLGPSVGIDVMIRESRTGRYTTGLIPGVGYGFKWGRREADGSITPWLALDVFVQGATSEEVETHSGPDYFNIDVLPVVTVLNLVSVGFGRRWKLGLTGQSSAHAWLFSFGIRKAT